MTLHQFWSPIMISLQVTIIASIIAFIFAVSAAWLMKKRSFRGKSLIETMFLLPLVLPPSVVGFGLLVLLGQNSWIGLFIETIFEQSLVFTKGAAVVSAFVVAFPLIYMTLKSGFEQIDHEFEDAARSMGAGEVQVFWYVTLPMAWRSLITGYVLGFARSIGEFGATLMFAGNIPGKTQTLPTAIYLAVEAGNKTQAYYWVITIVIFSFFLLMLTNIVKS